MTITETLKQAENEGAQMLRQRKEPHIKNTPYQYDVKPLFTGNKKGWVILDAYTASAMQNIYNALRPDLQTKFDNIPLNKLIDFTWSKRK